MEKILEKMQNKTMAHRLANGMTISLHSCEVTPEGYYIVPESMWNDSSMEDYCDMIKEIWIYSIGRHKITGIIYASIDSIFYKNDDFKCLFLR